MSDNTINIQPQNDHDAIVTLVAEVRQIRTDIKEVKDNVRDLKDNFASRVDTLEREKLDRVEANRLKEEGDRVNAAHDIRITRLERAYLIGFGVLLAAEFYLRFFAERN